MADIFEDDVEYARTFLKVRPKNPDGTYGGLVSLIPRHAQIHLSQHWNNKLVILKARQMGCSTWILARMTRKTLNFHGVNSLTVSHDAQTTKYLLEIAKTFYDELPEEVRPRRRYNNVNMMSFPGLKSTLGILTSTRKGKGHGQTITNLHASEYAYWENPGQFSTMTEAVPDFPQCDTVVESTPNGASGGFYELYQQAKAGKGGWKAVFMPWWFDITYSIPLEFGESLEPYSTEEEALIVRHKLTPEQIKWRRKKMEDFAAKNQGDVDLFFQEYPEDDEACFLTSGNCFFYIATLRIMKQQCYEAPFIDGEWHIYELPKTGRTYVCGADVALGNEGDDKSAAVIRDLETGRRVAVFNSILSPFEFAEELARMGQRYHNAVLAVERNNAGISTLEKLARDLGYEPLYWHSDGKLGWITSSLTRLPMLNLLKQEVYTQLADIPDERIISQMLTFLKGKGVGGKPEAASGEHDDLVIADAIACTVSQSDWGGAIGDIDSALQRRG